MKRARYWIVAVLVLAIVILLWGRSQYSSPPDSPRPTTRGCLLGGDDRDAEDGEQQSKSKPTANTRPTVGSPTKDAEGEWSPADPAADPDNPTLDGPDAELADWDNALFGGVLGQQPQGTINIYDEPLTTLHPLFPRNMADIRAQTLVFDRLFYRSSINDERRSRLVGKYEKRDEQFILTLTPDIYWHDGEDFTAEDVCFTVRAILDPGTPTTLDNNIRESLVGCQTDGELTATITMKRAHHDFRDRLGFAILPEHVFNTTTLSPDHDFGTRPIGTGSMSAIRGRRAVKFQAFPNAHHQPSITNLIISEGGAPLVQMRTLLNGGIQGLTNVPPSLRKDIARVDDFVLKSYDLRSVWYIAINTHNEVLGNAVVRQALQHLIHPPRLVELTIGIDPDDLLPVVEYVSGPFLPSSSYCDRDVDIPTYSPKKAARKMTVVGYEKRGGRWTNSSGPLSLRLGMDVSLDNEAPNLLDHVRNVLVAAGFDVKVSKITGSDFRNLQQRGTNNYDLLIGKWSFDLIEDVEAMFHTREKGWGSRNIFNYSNHEVDQLLETFATTSSAEEAQKAYQQLHRTVATEVPHIYLWKLDTKGAFHMSVRNNTISPHTFFEEFDGWRLE
ncbi:MAG: ABC transporter substrate-binding protein [Proteobacteria bacterium]|nr:ABC transporter substrate-binding protein [Pseudomonadota bacterium]